MDNCMFNPYQGEDPFQRMVLEFQSCGEMSDDSLETLPSPTKTRVNSSHVGQPILKPRNLSDTFQYEDEDPAEEEEEEEEKEEEEEQEQEEEEAEHEEEEEENEDEKDTEIEKQQMSTPQKKTPEFKLIMNGEDTWAFRTWDNEPANDTFCSKSGHAMSPGNK